MSLPPSLAKPVPEPTARNAIAGVFGFCGAVAGYAAMLPMWACALVAVLVFIVMWLVTYLFYRYVAKPPETENENE